MRWLPLPLQGASKLPTPVDPSGQSALGFGGSGGGAGVGVGVGVATGAAEAAAFSGVASFFSSSQPKAKGNTRARVRGTNEDRSVNAMNNLSPVTSWRGGGDKVLVASIVEQGSGAPTQPRRGETRSVRAEWSRKWARLTLGGGL